LSFEGFTQDYKAYSATIREYIVIGETIVAIKKPLENCFPDYSWRMIKDFRNFIRPPVLWDRCPHYLGFNHSRAS
jgi:uncharacterized protein with HEPN domain